MKIVITILTFLVWSFGSTYWYVCKIKFLCDDTMVETTVNQVDIALMPTEIIKDTTPTLAIDTSKPPVISQLPDSATTKKISYNKSFNIKFKYKSTEYINTVDLEKDLKELANFSKSNPNATIKVIGHTDNVGSAPTNIVLGQGRAESVMKSIYTYGATKNKIEASSKGETEPIADNSTPEGQIKNRRVQIIVEN